MSIRQSNRRTPTLRVAVPTPTTHRITARDRSSINISGSTIAKFKAYTSFERIDAFLDNIKRLGNVNIAKFSNAILDNGKTPLILAIESKFANPTASDASDISKFIDKYDVVVYDSIAPNETTPLIIACGQESGKIAALLIKNI